MSKTPIKRFSKLTALQEQGVEQKETVVNQTSEQNPEQTNQPEKNQTNQNTSISFDVLKTDLVKEDSDFSGQTANTPIFAELNMVLGQISENAGIPYYKLVNNILYDWLLNNKETITKAKKMSKEKNALAKRFL